MKRFEASCVFDCSPQAQKTQTAEAIGIWDGTEFVFQSSTSMWELLPRMFLRYGMSVWRMQRATQDAVSRLLQIYNLQKAGVAFDSPRTMYEELGLWLIAQQPAYDYFDDKQVSHKFMHEFVDAASRCNYLQVRPHPSKPFLVFSGFRNRFQAMTPNVASHSTKTGRHRKT
eukprot:2244448-Pyramimonas_sp.AAC.1